jgi:hypothetical protein
VRETVGNGDREAAEEEREVQARAIDRVTLFSDAVVAIAITLLALELPVPKGDTVAAFWSSVWAENRGHYTAFLISFWLSRVRGATITTSSGMPGAATRGCGGSTWPGC